ncbi:uncharacterized protein LOC130449612 [Diorhabda sublineata]|uniref:uncharacterized protein LOC130449612 n=1 Tax=Diorhabda sublineata TaxID=1163346 RepID=UPI0024E0F469|nr:uncharacterized protein LOC130449612 [Diorhabda sublineata]
MAYNLRRRTIRQELLDEMQEVPSEDEEAQGSGESENEGVSEHESEYSYATDASSELDSDMEDATLDKRLLEARARGRPTSTLKGKDGFKWNTRAPERRSDRVSDVLPAHVPGPNGDAKNLDSIEKFWDILFNDEMIDIMVEHTNKKKKSV